MREILFDMAKGPELEAMTHYRAYKHLFDDKLIGDIIKKYPETSVAVKKYFGQDCLQRPSFKIKTLEIACILFGVDENRLIREIEKIGN